MDAFLPGIGDWNSVFLLRDLWHFHFYGKTPLALVEGRERIYLEHFWNDFAADPAHSVSEADREFYAKAYAQPGAMKASFEVFRAFPQDAEDFAAFAKTTLTMPMLVLSGEKAGGQFLIDQGRMVDSDVEGVIIKGSGHWLMDEAPDQVIPMLVAFFQQVGAFEAGRRRFATPDPKVLYCAAFAASQDTVGLLSANAPVGFCFPGPHMQLVERAQAIAVGRAVEVEQLPSERGWTFRGDVFDRHQRECPVGHRLVHHRFGAGDVDGIVLQIVCVDVVDAHGAAGRAAGAWDRAHSPRDGRRLRPETGRWPCARCLPAD